MDVIPLEKILAPKTSIKALLSVTGVVALWLAFYQINMNASLMFLAWFLIAAISILNGNSKPFFWLPLFASINFLTLSFLPWWLGPDQAIVLAGGVIASIIAIYTFSKFRTLASYRNKTDRRGVLLAGIGNSGLGGVCSGLMLGLPFFLLALVFLLQGEIGLFLTAITTLIMLPLVGGLLGLLVGIGFGFVFDIMVALEFRKRTRTSSRWITIR